MFSGITPLTAETTILSFKETFSFLNSSNINAEGIATIIISAFFTTELMSELIAKRLVFSLVEVK